MATGGPTACPRRGAGGGHDRAGLQAALGTTPLGVDGRAGAGTGGDLSVYAVNGQALLAVIGRDSINVARLHPRAPATTGRLAELLDGVTSATAG